ncbi:hypothetical protein Pmani_006472 [Petrolisthes manimaculis]|uniref:Uncharacterized protein n=1 Tax=Petrolisthes manimaculis TaxID=1843537 RepID=A0AAE1UJK4_9EUCA|nr:hypothetical protein Pmani_006472 [Petrolisthes manimaculis]
MGLVNLADMLISLYLTAQKSTMWYLPMFGQLVDMSVVNAWLKYRRDKRLLDNGKPKSHCVFRSEIAFSLPRAGRPARRGRPSSAEVPQPAKKIMRAVAQRTTDVRYDNIDHWPIHADKGRCRLCPKG